MLDNIYAGKLINKKSFDRQLATSSKIWPFNFWSWWLLSLLVISTLFIWCMEYASIIFMDELMTVDLGRTILNPYTDWSIAWMADEQKPVFLLTYLGPVLQEALYQVGGELGPKLSALLGAITASTILVWWFVLRGTARSAAFILGLSFLLDPLFSQAYTTGRIDGWAMALCILSCCVLRYTAVNVVHEAKFKLNILLGGVLVSLGFFTWASAVFLFPLVVLELIFLIKRRIISQRNRNEAVLVVTLFITGGFGAGLLLLIPISSQLYNLFGSMMTALFTNTQHGGSPVDKVAISQYLTPLIDLLRVLKFTPFLLLFALISCLWKRDIGLIAAMLMVTALMMGTLVYICRVQYLLPYFFASIAMVFSSKSIGKTKFYKVRFIGLILVFVWSAVLTLLVRTAMALHKPEERDKNLVAQAARSTIGSGNHTVALFSSFEFYYVGRQLGWKMFAPYKPAFKDVYLEKMKKTLAKVDYVIIAEEQLTEANIHLFKEEGMTDKGEILIYKDQVAKDHIKDHTKTTNLNRLQNLFKIDRQPYGPYRFFARGESSLASATVD